MICITCVSPAPLKNLVAANGQKHTCLYCNKAGISVPREFLFDYILERVNENLAREGDLSDYEHTMLYECGDGSIAVQSIDVVLVDWFDLGDEPYIDDVLNYAPHEFKTDARGNDAHFYMDGGLLERNFYDAKWDKFVEDIRHSHRFFNPNARGFLDSVFAFLSNGDELKAECIRIVTKGEFLYRARTANTYEEANKIQENPAGQFGPTPRDRASSQRMTPNGISAMYCALARETCLSEIRSITGDYVISVGLTPVAQLKLLDLTQLEMLETAQLTLLEKGYLDAHHLKIFVSSLVKKMSKPKGRYDELSYLSTQVVFEYLRLRFGSQVDGLVFPSVQTGEKGTNVVLFPEASVVRARKYALPTPLDRAIGVEPDNPSEDNPFEPEAKLAWVAGSLRFHKVQAIETRSVEYGHISELFMNDLTRARLHIPN
jgi:hypothetical protein